MAESHRKAFIPYPILRAVGTLVSILGLLVFWGWFSGNTSFKSLTGVSPSIPILIALGFLFCGLGFFSLRYKFKWMTRTCAVTIFIFGCLLLVEFLFRKPGSDFSAIALRYLYQNSFLNRGYWIEGLCFILIGCFFGATTMSNLSRRIHIESLISAVIFSFGSISLVGQVLLLSMVANLKYLTSFGIGLGLFVVALGLLLISYIDYQKRSHSFWSWVLLPLGISVFIGSIVMWDALRKQEWDRIRASTNNAAYNVKTKISDFMNERLTLVTRVTRRREALLPYNFGDTVFEIDATSVLRDYPDAKFIQRFDKSLGEEGIHIQPGFSARELELLRFSSLHNRRIKNLRYISDDPTEEPLLITQEKQGFRVVAPLFAERKLRGYLSVFFTYSSFFKQFANLKPFGGYLFSITDDKNNYLYKDDFPNHPNHLFAEPASVDVDSKGLKFRIFAIPDDQTISAQLTKLPWVVLVSGLLMSFLIIWSYVISQAMIHYSLKLQETNALLTQENAQRLEAEIALQKAHLDLEKKVLERTQQLTRSNQELEQFAYVCSHDLQEPLRKISNFASLLQIKCKDTVGEEGERLIEKIFQSVQRLHNLIQDLLVYSRMGHDERKQDQINLTDMVKQIEDDIVGTAEDKKGKVISDKLPTVRGDGSQLRQLFQNLISNGLKYKGSDPPVVRISCAKEDQAYVFCIEDNGIGVAKEYQQQIFNLFTRLHTKSQYPGTGIGLATCKKIVEKMGGKIWVESEIGRGSKFFFTLPFSPN